MEPAACSLAVMPLAPLGAAPLGAAPAGAPDDCGGEDCAGGAAALLGGVDGTPAASGILFGTSDQPGGDIGGLAAGALGFDGAGASRGSEPVTSMLRSSASMRASRRSRSAVS